MKITVNNTCAIVSNPERLLSGMVGKTIDVEFSADWDSLLKTAIFTNGITSKNKENPTDVIEIPWEVLALPNKHISVAFYGYRIENGVKVYALPTIYAEIGVTGTGGDPSGDPSNPPTPEVAEQILGLIGDLDNLETPTRDNLVHAINDAYNGGGGGGSFDIHALRLENAIADADETPFYDLSANASRKTTWSNIKAKLKTYFDTVYLGALALTGYATQAWVNAQGFLKQHQSLAAYRTSAAQDVIDGSKVDKTTTVNGKALSGNINLNASDVGAATEQYVGNAVSDATSDMATQTWVSGRGYITADDIPVLSVNGKTGIVTLTAADLGISAIFDLKGSKATVSALPTTGNKYGDVWYVIAESVGYIWLNDGTTDRWEMLGMSVDLSNYATKTELTTALTGYVAKVAGKGLSTNDFTDAYKTKLDSAITSLAGYATETYVDNGLSGKQDTISDLATIRSGAAAGATALQSVPSTYRTSAAQDVIDAGKLAEPSSGLAVGKYFRIASIDEDGHAVLEAVDAPETGMKIKFNNVEQQADADGFIDIPQIHNSTTQLGLCFATGVAGVRSWSGQFLVVNAEQPSFTNRATVGGYKFGVISATNFDLAVKVAMTDGIGTAWTTAEKQGALARLGITVDEQGICHFNG